MKVGGEGFVREDDEGFIGYAGLALTYKAVKFHSFPLMLFGYQLELICGSVRFWA